jgi:hypothetical protein
MQKIISDLVSKHSTMRIMMMCSARFLIVLVVLAISHYPCHSYVTKGFSRHEQYARRFSAVAMRGVRIKTITYYMSAGPKSTSDAFGIGHTV